MGHSALSYKRQKILILGANGMLGSAMFYKLSEDTNLDVFGTIRNSSLKSFFKKRMRTKLAINADAQNFKSIEKIIRKIDPDIIINCIGVIKQKNDVENLLKTIPINSLFPHQLHLIANEIGARLILISTDCVFDGTKGDYSEDDVETCKDLYGRSKLLGEIHDSSNIVTIRTSIIGHEFGQGNSLVNWFLSQNNEINGYTKAIFSGFPTNALAEIIRDNFIIKPNLHGLFHVSSESISKYDLLKLIAKTYGKKIIINRSEELIVDRSLNHNKLKDITGFSPENWEILIKSMKSFYEKYYN